MSEYGRPTRRWLLLAAGLMIAVTGCGGGDTPTAVESSTEQPAAVQQAAPAPPIDACALVPADTVSSLLGIRVKGRSTSRSRDARLRLGEPADL